MSLSRGEIRESKAKLEILRSTFPNSYYGLLMFAQHVITETIAESPELNRIQADMLDYLYSGPRFRMLQAQRGQTKTALTAIYSSFRIMHKPTTRVLIFSQNGKRAKEISGWVVKIFNRLKVLEVLRPVDSEGDRSSIENFDVSYLFRGGDKSPSVACQSIEGGAQGARADIVIADDIESLKVSRSVVLRAVLEDDCLEFESINSNGEIIYLGTPQTVNSIYNGLEGRGYSIRIWPGRYPTSEDMLYYGDRLAPMLQEDMDEDPSIMTGFGLHGDMGAVTCPEMFDEEELVSKEIRQGKAKFKLQRMLNTSLADEDTYPLKLRSLIIGSFSVNEGMLFPIKSTERFHTSWHLGNKVSDKLFMMVQKEYTWKKFEEELMYIDTAGGGQNGDETAYAIIKRIGTYIYLYDIGAVKGGYEEIELMKLVEACKASGVKTVWVEKNFGYGSHASALKSLFNANWPVHLEEDYATGQKEQRIIDVLEPIISSNRMIVHPNVIEKDYKLCDKYPTEKKITFNLLHQMSNLTREKGCLVHDDRLDALAGGLKQMVDKMDYDMRKHEKDATSGQFQDLLKQVQKGYGNTAGFKTKKAGLTRFNVRRN